MEQQIFGGAAVLETFAKVDLDAADLADALDACELGLALLEDAIGLVALAGDLFKALAQPLGGDGLGQWIGQIIGRCHARLHVPGR